MNPRRHTALSISVISLLLLCGMESGLAGQNDMDAQREGAHHGLTKIKNPSPQQRIAADNLIADTRAAIARFDNFEQALTEGYQEATRPGVPPRRFGPVHFRNPRYVRDGKLLDPDHPEGLVYWKRPDGTKVLLGAYFTAPIGQGPEVGGPLTHWHNHVGKCPLGARGEVLAQMSPPHCGPDAVPGLRTPEMLHVWRFDHPDGAFADHLGRAGVRALVTMYGADLVPSELQDEQGHPRGFHHRLVNDHRLMGMR